MLSTLRRTADYTGHNVRHVHRTGEYRNHCTFLKHPSCAQWQDHSRVRHSTLDLQGKTFAKGDAAAQARRCLEIIQSAIERLGGKLSDIMRTRILLTRIEDWEQVAAVHGEFFGSIRPANTVMQVVRFIDPEWLIEIEADAIVEDESDV